MGRLQRSFESAKRTARDEKVGGSLLTGVWKNLLAATKTRRM